MAKNIIDTRMDDDFTCTCGNQSSSNGFHPCDKEGREVEPLPSWDCFYLCGGCSQIYRDMNLVKKKEENMGISEEKKGFLVLYNNFNSTIYDVCYGTHKQGLKHLYSLRHEYGREIEADGDVYLFDTKEQAIAFVARGFGVIFYSSPEDYKQKQLQFAEEAHFQNIVYL